MQPKNYVIFALKCPPAAEDLGQGAGAAHGQRRWRRRHHRRGAALLQACRKIKIEFKRSKIFILDKVCQK
jgi:hypothetical protein